MNSEACRARNQPVDCYFSANLQVFNCAIDRTADWLAGDWQIDLEHTHYLCIFIVLDLGATDEIGARVDIQNERKQFMLGANRSSQVVSGKRFCECADLTHG